MIFYLGSLFASQTVSVNSLSTNTVYGAMIFESGITTSTMTLTGILQLPSYTKAQILAMQPTAPGLIVRCSDCSDVPICVSTGTSIGNWALITSKKKACN